MKYVWIIWLLVPGLMHVSGIFYLCDKDLANERYEELFKYSSIATPPYFKDEAERNTTCGNIHLSVEYIWLYKTSCRGGEEFFKKMLDLNYTLLNELNRLCSEYNLLWKANNWNTEVAESYWTQLKTFMYDDIPLYGKDVEELNEVCRNTVPSIQYLLIYLDMYKKKECESYQCLGLTNDVNNFFSFSGIKDLVEGLCTEHSLIRKTYLEIYPCLENNSHHFFVCKNKADVSMEYMSMIYYEKVKIKRETCCATALLRDCMISVTEDHCDVNATRFLSFVVDSIHGNFTDEVCLSSGILCSGPPLPPEVDHTEKVQYKNEYGTFEHKNSETDKVKSYEKVKDRNDSNIDKIETISSSIISCPGAGTMIVSSFFLFMHFLTF